MESEFIAWLRKRLPPHPNLKLGPGDDTAILRLAAGHDCLLTVDALTDQVDFRLEEIDPRRAGRKALAVNLSDIAAMGGTPVAAVVALVLPRQGGWPLAVAIFEGMLPLAERYGVAIAGGDTNSWDGPLVISVTLVGQTTERPPLLRSGARAGDKIIVTGAFGGSILGHHLDFEPRVAEAKLINERYAIHAAIDVSDGLSLDLSRMTAESNCGARIDLAAIPLSAAAVELGDRTDDKASALDHALGDGEDFELILAVPPEDAARMLAEQPAGVRLTAIGEFVAEPGLWTLDAGGGRHRFEPRGFRHEFGL